MSGGDSHELRRWAQRLLPRRLRRGQFARPPLVGYLDGPTVRADGARVAGWLYSPSGGIERLVARVDGHDHPLAVGHPRADIARLHPEAPQAARSGFAGDVPRGRGPVELWAVLGGGRRLLAFVIPELGGADAPAPPPVAAAPSGPATVAAAGPEPATAPPEASFTSPAAAPAAEARSGPVPLDGARVAALADRLDARTLLFLGSPPAALAAARARLSVVDGGAALPAGAVAIDGAPEDAVRQLDRGAFDLIVADVHHAALVESYAHTLAAGGLLVIPDGAAPDPARWIGVRADGLRLLTPLPPALLRALDAAAGAPRPLATSDAPQVSIVIPVRGRWELTRRCLLALAAAPPRRSFEVLVVDDGSPDDTLARLAEWPTVRAVVNARNLGFGGACNHGAQEARGTYVVFLNNDTVPLPGWLDELADTVEAVPRAGLVGAKLILEDGRLQEAGGQMWQGGAASNVGRGDDPERPEHSYLRDADYCSGACILLPTALFRSLGGFDERYAPAYYEDGDLAFQVRAAGYRVLFQPLARVRHKEGGTAGTDTSTGIKRYQVINQALFHERWRRELAGRPVRPADGGKGGWDAPGPARVLVLDHQTPHPDRDSGSLRMAGLLEILVELGLRVTFLPGDVAHEGRYTEALQRRGVEVLYRPFVPSVEAHLADQGARYDAVIVSRRDIAADHLPAIRRHTRCPVVLDTVDLHFVREEREAALTGRSAGRARERELKLLDACEAAIVVSPTEKTLLRELRLRRPVHVIGNVHRVEAGAPPFAARRDLFFVGWFGHPPNVDGLGWFLEQVWPLVRARRPELQLHVAGGDAPASLRARGDDGVVWHGLVPDLRPLLDGSRLMVAPLRYGAGVKGKLTQALSHGLPAVVTPIAAEGMELRDGVDVVVAATAAEMAQRIAALIDDEAAWTRLSQGALATARRTVSIEAVRPKVAALLESLGIALPVR